MTHYFRIIKAGGNRLFLSAFFSLLFCPLLLSAQQWELGLGLGAMNYKGDIASSIKPRFSRLGGTGFVRYNAGRAFCLKASLIYGHIFAADQYSDDPFNQVRDRSFKSRIFEFSPQVEYNFFNYRSEHSRQRWTPYLFGGLALFNYANADYGQTQIALPFGVGAKYVIGGSWNLGLEFGARKTFTDYLDALGGDLTPNKFQNGNPNTKDMYFYTGLTLSYTFYKVHCPEFY